MGEACHKSGEYKRRRPEFAPCYQIIQEHLETFIQNRSQEGRPLPEYVLREFEAYLNCGIPAFGFLRLVCQGCREEHVFAFSCKKRGFCPSCCAKRRTETRIHLLENMLAPLSFTDWPGGEEIRTVAFWGRKFFGNSFNVSGGLIYGAITDTKLVGEESTGANECSYSGCQNNLEYSEIRSYFAIGNQWQWDYFTLGCDWFGIALSPLYQKIWKSELRRIDLNTGDDIGESSGKKPSPSEKAFGRVLVLYLGASF